MNVNPEAERSASGMMRARSLYGSLAEQMTQPNSFARRLQKIIRMRKQYGLATAVQVDVPNVAHPAMLVMVHKIEGGLTQVTVLNFGDQHIAATVHSEHLPPGGVVNDMVTSEEVATVDELYNFPLTLEPYEGRGLIIADPQIPTQQETEQEQLTGTGA
jgi:maltose alpha-D-glucosyltransferase/alpha-amylase